MTPNLLLRFLSICLIINISIDCFGQFEIVTFNFSTKTFDKPFPFDVPFRIKFVKINPDIDRVEIYLKNITRTRHIVKDLRKQNGFVSNENIFNHKDAPKPFFGTVTDINRGDSSAIIDVIVRLKPNQTYFAEIKGGGLRNLKHI